MRISQLLPIALAAPSLAQGVIAPKTLDIKSAYSVRNVAATIARDAMTYYKGNTSSTPKDMGDLQDPYYWWVAGALWGSLLDYYHYTKDPSYNEVVLQALLAPTNIGPNFDYMPNEHADEEGNDDLYFWGSAALAAAERNFPQPDAAIPSWIEIGANVFNSLKGRWNTTHCTGGLTWQIYADNPNGMNYKNSVSNGGFFQLAARLARATGNATYLEWAEKIWDWSAQVGFIDSESYHVYDGIDSANGCTGLNKVSFTYTSGIYLQGAALLANHTNDAKWSDRATKLLGGAGWFFSPFENATNIMYEGACETVDKCTADSSTHKAFLSRNMWQATLMMPSLRADVEKLLGPSALAAAKSCQGGDSGSLCGTKWYVGGYDGTPGLGQQMTALETIQGWLIHASEPPYKGDQIKTVREKNWKPIDTYQPDSSS